MWTFYRFGDKVIYPNQVSASFRHRNQNHSRYHCGFYHLRMSRTKRPCSCRGQRRRRRSCARAISDEEIERSSACSATARSTTTRTGRAASRTIRTACDRVDLRRGRGAEEPHLPRAFEKPVVPREADARPREVPRLSEISDVSHEKFGGNRGESGSRALERLRRHQDSSIARAKGRKRPRRPRASVHWRTAKAS
jgi:hypothetical protein